MEELGVNVLLGRTTVPRSSARARRRRGALRRHAARRRSRGRRRRHPPNVELGDKAGVIVNRGIVVNDYMETSRPDIFAVGECVEHRGVCYGLVAPLYEQGKVLAATMTGHRGRRTRARAGGEAQDHGRRRVLRRRLERAERRAGALRGSRARRLQEGHRRDGKLAGVILVGDTSDSHRYMEWLRTDADLASSGVICSFPAAGRRRLDVAEMSDSATVCGCVGVTKGTIIDAIHERGVNTMSQLKESTRASTGCGSCTSSVRTCCVPSRRFEDEQKKVICALRAVRRGSLREILRSQR
jgi:nitrite reductase (NADH) large subunit